jgi:hypothetical protein
MRRTTRMLNESGAGPRIQNHRAEECSVVSKSEVFSSALQIDFVTSFQIYVHGFPQPPPPPPTCGFRCHAFYHRPSCFRRGGRFRPGRWLRLKCLKSSELSAHILNPGAGPPSENATRSMLGPRWATVKCFSFATSSRYSEVYTHVLILSHPPDVWFTSASQDRILQHPRFGPS